MAYSVDGIATIETFATSSRTADDGASDLVWTGCGTNGTLAEACDEIKNTLSAKITFDTAGTLDTAGTNLIRVYVDSLMAAGDVYLLPYTDANSVSGTNELGPLTIADSAWNAFTLDSAFIGDLDVSGGQFSVRYASDGTSKPKVGEVESDLTYLVDTLAGVTRDVDGAVLVSCGVYLFKKETGNELTFIEYQVSHGTTGAYSFDVIPSQDYMVYAWKTGTPPVFDATDLDLQGV